MATVAIVLTLLALVLLGGHYVFRRFNSNPLVVWLFVFSVVIVLVILILFPTLWLH